MLYGETPTTRLTYRNLAECIYESSLPYLRLSIEPQYLRERVRLLRQAFGLDAEGYRASRGKPLPAGCERFFNGQSLPSIDLFGVQGVLEISADAPEAVAWQQIQTSHGQAIEDVLRTAADLRKKWILLYLEALVDEEAKSRSIEVSWLLERGLPARDPEWDPFDHY